jgi:hypothetical protein
MKSFPQMVDMKTEKPADPMGLVAPQVSDLPDYDYGLNISFNKESLEKLDLEESVSVGDYVHIHAFARVTCVSQDPGSDTLDRVSMVLTHIACEDEDSEGEDDESEDGAE